MKKNTLMILVVVFGLFSVTSNAFAAQPDTGNGEEVTTTTFAQPDTGNGEEGGTTTFAQPDTGNGEETSEPTTFAQPDTGNGEEGGGLVERVLGLWNSLFKSFSGR